jgi:hypothetical protein
LFRIFQHHSHLVYRGRAGAVFWVINLELKLFLWFIAEELELFYDFCFLRSLSLSGPLGVFRSGRWSSTRKPSSMTTTRRRRGRSPDGLVIGAVEEVAVVR